jgi:hypothetical protein
VVLHAFRVVDLFVVFFARVLALPLFDAERTLPALALGGETRRTGISSSVVARRSGVFIPSA